MSIVDRRLSFFAHGQMLKTIFCRSNFSATISLLRSLSLTPKSLGSTPIEQFQGSNWQPADVIQTDDPPEPEMIPDNWDKYNRIVYPPNNAGQTIRAPVRLCRSEQKFHRIFQSFSFLSVRSSLSIVRPRKHEKILVHRPNGE